MSVAGMKRQLRRLQDQMTRRKRTLKAANEPGTYTAEQAQAALDRLIVTDFAGCDPVVIEQLNALAAMFGGEEKAPAWPVDETDEGDEQWLID